MSYAVAAVLVLGAGCAGGEQASGDCQTQVRVGDEVFTEYSTTRREPVARAGLAAEAECHDTGRDAPGSVFGDDPRQVEVWSFDGYDPDEVLAAPFGARRWRVFIADSVSRDAMEEIARELR